MNELLTTADVGLLAAVSPRTVARLVAAGTLTPVRIGRAVRFKRSDVMRWIKTL
jgi:excisionase family DNA binding protein